ncbi:MAG: two component, sigma54 specific, transcriptional regulator, Fis family, partial [Acidobacteria bacterium]|nr:two component, sigma54 specific, transcriptional regulator, Fis family [Acidobacteriota bacterium]
EQCLEQSPYVRGEAGNATSRQGFSLIGTSPAMVEAFKFISRVAATDSTVYVQGETGTGKELVARLIHENGPRRDNRLVVVDCGALPGTLLESELFGAVRGAYTGADRDRTGLLESAEGGTVFLDEIGEIDLAFQLRLLRFLQEREVRPVGSTASRKGAQRRHPALGRAFSRGLPAAIRPHARTERGGDRAGVAICLAGKRAAVAECARTAGDFAPRAGCQ